MEIASLNYDFFYYQLEAGKRINETRFYFADDEREEEHFLGYMPQCEKPYWVGFCDIPNGTAFPTAQELVTARIFQGKSLQERWQNVRIVSIEGVSLKDWLESLEYFF